MYNMNTLGFLVIVHSLFPTLGNAVTILQDLPHLPVDRWALPPARPFNRQEHYQGLNLRSKESFFWGGQNGASPVFGNLTVSMPGTNENIISMQRFKDMTTSVTCSNASIDIVFKNEQTLAYAKDVWDWVNGADNHTFIMVAGTGDCGWNDHRIPFMVSTLHFNDKSMAARLTAKATQWSDAIHTYSLDVGAMPLANITPSAIFPRSQGELGLHWNKDFSLDFNHKIPSASFTLGPYKDRLSLSVACIYCMTTGEWEFGFHLETFFWVPKKAYATLQPKGVSLTISPMISLNAKLKKTISFTKDFFTIPLAGLRIPGGIMDLGPELVFSTGLEFGPITGSGTISSGVTISVPDTAILTINFLSPHSESSGWKAKVEKKPIILTASVAGQVRIYIQVALKLAAKAAGKGFDTGIALAPFISTSLTAIDSTGPACKLATEKHAQGLNATTLLGVEVEATVKRNDKTLFSTNVLGYRLPLSSTCVGYGPPRA